MKEERGGEGDAECFSLAQPSSDPALCVSVVSMVKHLRASSA